MRMICGRKEYGVFDKLKETLFHQKKSDCQETHRTNVKIWAIARS